jgi:hypothetical protein
MYNAKPHWHFDLARELELFEWLWQIDCHDMPDCEYILSHM